MSTTIASSSTDQQHSVNQVVVFGDSLSDRGLLNQKAKGLCREVFNEAPFHGAIPYFGLEKLIGFDNSSKNRFTNGYTWADDLSVNIINDNFVNQSSTYNLQNPNEVTYPDGCILLRSYAEGGATAANYRTFSQVFKYIGKAAKDLFHLDFKSFKTDIEDGFSSLIVNRIDNERKDFLKDDKGNPDKSKTLIMEWSGANDLLTVNNDLLSKEYDSKALKAEINKAVDARINNTQKLIEKGYKNFTLIGLPDFSVTPRLQRQPQTIQDRASEAVEKFNTKLKNECDKLQKKYGGSINIKFFDINPQLKDIYENPEKYGFDPNKKTEPFIESKAFQNEKDNNFGFSDGSTSTQITDKYIFWDDIHPSAQTHELLSKEIYKDITSTYRFEHAGATKPDTSYDTLSIMNSHVNTSAYKPSSKHTPRPVTSFQPMPNRDTYASERTPTLVH